uniref:Arf-GAP with coiled-coil, ANK repeat and PH domain-containing protein n=1 Tax=Pelodiscus sinensis TaxID=13735 RepID=K7G2D2_PELSI
MEQRHAMIKQKDLSQDEAVLEGRREALEGVVMEGYLYKRASNAFKTWSRRWFSIQSNQLVYQKRAKDVLTVVVDDLRLCTVKLCPDQERRFCFEVVSPSKSCLLQADSERHQQAWLSAVQSSIASAFSEGRAEPPSQHPERPASMSSTTMEASGRSPRTAVDKRVLDQVQRLEGNAQCCDCREPAPEWASINLGITLCIECSGIHRSLGVHFSKVRSLTLDSWEPELVKLMCELGNSALNRIYEARVDEMTVKRPQPGCSRAEKESWIRAKYVEKKFITKLPEARLSRVGRWGPHNRDRPPKPALKPKPGGISRAAGGTGSLAYNSRIPEPGEAGSSPEDLHSLHPGALLYWAAGNQNLPTMADALAHGADVNWVNAAEESRTPLLQAVAVNSLLACDFLLQNGAKEDPCTMPPSWATPGWLACSSNEGPISTQLMRRGRTRCPSPSTRPTRTSSPCCGWPRCGRAGGALGWASSGCMMRVRLLLRGGKPLGPAPPSAARRDRRFIRRQGHHIEQTCQHRNQKQPTPSIWGEGAQIQGPHPLPVLQASETHSYTSSLSPPCSQPRVLPLSCFLVTPGHTPLLGSGSEYISQVCI